MGCPRSSLWNREQIWLYHSNGSHHAQNYFWKDHSEFQTQEGLASACFPQLDPSMLPDSLTHLLIPPLTFSALHCFLKNIWLHWGLAATCAIFSCGMRTPGCSMWDPVPWPGMKPGPHIGNVESQSLDHQVSPYTAFKALMTTVLLLVATATLHSGDPPSFCPNVCQCGSLAKRKIKVIYVKKKCMCKYVFNKQTHFHIYIYIYPISGVWNEV